MDSRNVKISALEAKRKKHDKGNQTVECDKIYQASYAKNLSGYRGYAGRGIFANDILSEIYKPASPCEALQAQGCPGPSIKR